MKECQSKIIAKGYCNKHYLRFRKYGDPEKTSHKMICSANECNKKHFGSGLCEKHYRRKYRRGHPNFMIRLEPLSGTLRERFEKSYTINPQNGCWEWNRQFNVAGYAKIEFTNELGRRKSTGGHRVSYRLYKGEIKDGLFVCHSCDNAKCVNPEHLWLGTHQDNMDDMDRKGRRNLTRKKKPKEEKKANA